MSNYTKGPWVSYLGNPRPCIGSVSGSIASCTGGRAPSTYANGMTREEAMANAKLIACAPEMAEMLLSLRSADGAITALLKKAGVL